jgi:hypothetical protein
MSLAQWRGLDWYWITAELDIKLEMIQVLNLAGVAEPYLAPHR